MFGCSGLFVIEVWPYPDGGKGSSNSKMFPRAGMRMSGT